MLSDKAYDRIMKNNENAYEKYYREQAARHAEQFPTHYEDACFRVYTNSSDELFIENKKSGVKMRMNARYDGSLEYTTHNRVEPINVNGMIGWRISQK